MKQRDVIVVNGISQFIGILELKVYMNFKNLMGQLISYFMRPRQQSQSLIRPNLPYTYIDEEFAARSKKRGEENRRKINALEAQGHHCITIIETDPSIVTWCKKAVCSGTALPDY